LGNIHWGPLLAAVTLAMIGLATVSSASSETGTDYLPRQALWIGVGLVAMLVAVAIDYHALLDLAPFFYGGAVALMIAVLVVGREVGGARTWLGVGPFGGQPS
jgi:cell division protein FtsW (lipid II flippase)